MRRILIFLLFIVHSFISFCQNEIFKQLIRDTEIIYSSNYLNTRKLIPENSNNISYLKDKLIHLIKNGKETFGFVDGTGRLYKLNVENNNIKTTRLDSTIYFGYNEASYGFNFNNKIYNIGGYGIWRHNGQLREYNLKDKEWDIVKLNKEIPIKADACLLHHNKQLNKIYLGRYSLLNEAIRNSEFADDWVYSVMELDLETKNWTPLGDLSSFIRTQYNEIKELAITPYGLLIYLTGNLYILDYTKNEIFKIDDNSNQRITNFRRSVECFLYIKDSLIIYSNKDNTSIDTAILTKKKLIKIDEKIYKPNLNEQTANKFSIYFIPAIIILMALVIFMFNKKSKKIKPDDYYLKKESDVVAKKETPKTIAYQIFNEKELQVLQLIMNNSNNYKKTSVQELNAALGVSKKSNEIQKKYRSDVIIAINEKYAIYTNQNEHIIQRQKHDLDGRIFEYFIEQEKLATLSDILK